MIVCVSHHAIQVFVFSNAQSHHKIAKKMGLNFGLQSPDYLYNILKSIFWFMNPVGGFKEKDKMEDKIWIQVPPPKKRQHTFSRRLQLKKTYEVSEGKIVKGINVG